MQYFITRSNFIRITSKVLLSEEQVEQEIYKRSIYFFSKIDEQRILSVKQFLINAKDGFFKFKETGFIEDTYSFVYEESRYAKYHKDKKCEGLVSSFKDFEIPVEIKYKKGEQAVDVKRVKEFREWFKQEEIQDLYVNAPQKFIDKLQVKFQLQNPPKAIELHSQGVQGVSNLSQAELEKKIDDLISQASDHYKSSAKVRAILVNNNFSKQTYWVTSKKWRELPIKNNKTGYSDKEVREV